MKNGITKIILFVYFFRFYTCLQVDLGDSDDNRDKWEVVDRKPVIFPRSKKCVSGL